MNLQTFLFYFLFKFIKHRRTEKINNGYFRTVTNLFDDRYSCAVVFTFFKGVLTDALLFSNAQAFAPFLFTFLSSLSFYCSFGHAFNDIFLQKQKHNHYRNNRNKHRREYKFPGVAELSRGHFCKIKF